MLKETKDISITQTRKHCAIFFIALLIVALIAWFAWSAVNEQLHEQSKVSVRNAVLNSAKQCFAVEGAYPSSLSYLEKNYGLTIDHNAYVVSYEVFADNVMPDVVVSAK